MQKRKKNISLNSARISPFCKLIKILESIGEFLILLKNLANTSTNSLCQRLWLLVYTFNHLYHTGVTFLKKPEWVASCWQTQTMTKKKKPTLLPSG